MDKNLQEQKKFLKEQVEWCRKQEIILAEIEKKLYEMRNLAVYRYEHTVSVSELYELNSQMDVLKREVSNLELQLQSSIH